MIFARYRWQRQTRLWQSITVADAVVFLPDAAESAGARLERAYCEYIGKETEEWND